MAETELKPAAEPASGQWYDGFGVGLALLAIGFVFRS